MAINIISLLLLVSLLPNPTFTGISNLDQAMSENAIRLSTIARENVGIVNGKEAKPHSRPYMVSIQKKKKHSCGGFLISDQFVLTAAHCWDKGQTRTVVVGAHDLSDKKLLRFAVKSYIVHPDYKPTISSPRNDIMLLKLEKRVQLNTKVGLISLPKCEEFKVNCTVAGWGRLWSNGPRSYRLMEANTNINDAKCKQKEEFKFVASQMICGYSHGGPCPGDSGGPLVCGKPPTAVGITSFGDDCDFDVANYTNVYTRISAYLPWILKTIGK